jgi:branched-chain amino acid transport system ATP-binding protein
VQENLLLGATIRDDVEEVRSDVARLFGQFPILGARAGQPAGQLSGGEQQQLAIARALLSRPRLLMLDEPSLGLAPAIIDQVYRLLRSIHADGVTILLVEQNAERAFSISDRAYVMNGGAVTLEGIAADLAAHANFDAAYFGVSMREARNAG